MSRESASSPAPRSKPTWRKRIWHAGDSAIVASYTRAQITAPKVALLSVAVFVLICFCFTPALPDRPMLAKG